MSDSPNDPASTPEIAQVMERFVNAYIAEGQEKPQPMPLSDEYLVAWFTAAQMNGTRAPSDMVSRAVATLAAHRKNYAGPT